MRAQFPAGLSTRVDIAVADWTGKLGCVAAGLGVALVPALAVRAAPSDVVLRRLHSDDVTIRRVFAATPANRTTSSAVEAIIARLLDEAARSVP